MLPPRLICDPLRSRIIFMAFSHDDEFFPATPRVWWNTAGRTRRAGLSRDFSASWGGFGPKKRAPSEAWSLIRTSRMQRRPASRDEDCSSLLIRNVLCLLATHYLIAVFEWTQKAFIEEILDWHVPYRVCAAARHVSSTRIGRCTEVTAESGFPLTQSHLWTRCNAVGK